MKNRTLSTHDRHLLPRRGALAALVLFGSVAAWKSLPAWAAETAVAIPPPAEDVASAAAATSGTAVFAGGCFWGVQGVFQHVKGVTRAVSGYAGGDAGTATYRAVGSGRTGHAEAVRIDFDPKQVSYGQLLQIYFSVAHNPTELNRQGPDSGTQYRSTVFPQSAEQARVARAYIAQLNQARSFGKPLATTVELDRPFHEAEAYHQDYLTLHPRQPYIVVNDLPKVESLKRVFPERFRAVPVLVRGNT